MRASTTSVKASLHSTQTLPLHNDETTWRVRLMSFQDPALRTPPLPSLPQNIHTVVHVGCVVAAAEASHVVAHANQPILVGICLLLLRAHQVRSQVKLLQRSGSGIDRGSEAVVEGRLVHPYISTQANLDREKDFVLNLVAPQARRLEALEMHHKNVWARPQLHRLDGVAELLAV